MHGTTILLRRIEGRRLWDVARSCLRASGPRHAGVGTIDKGETGEGGVDKGQGRGGGMSMLSACSAMPTEQSQLKEEEGGRRHVH